MSAEISDDYFVHPTATVESGATIGRGTKIWHQAHIRSGAVIGDECVIGKNVFVDSGATIGSRCKVQNNVSVYSGVHIGDEVFVGPSAVFTNDRFPRAVGDWELSETFVNHGASIGANATLVCGITLGRYATVASGSVVTKNLKDFELVAGNPARRLGWVCVCGRVLLKSNEELDEASCEHCSRKYHHGQINDA